MALRTARQTAVDAAPTRSPRPPDWSADAVLAAGAWLGFVAVVVLHVVDVARDLAQEALRRQDLGRFTRDSGLQGLSRVAQAFGMAWFLVLIAALVCCVLAAFRQWRRVATVLAVTLATTLTVTVIKLSLLHPPVAHLLGRPVGSFPSGHTADVTAIVGVVLVSILPIRLRLLPYAIAIGGGIVVGGTRVVSGAHTPDDVVAGWLLGSALVLTAGTLLAASERHTQQRVAQVPDDTRR